MSDEIRTVKMAFGHNKAEAVGPDAPKRSYADDDAIRIWGEPVAVTPEMRNDSTVLMGDWRNVIPKDNA